MTARGKSPVRQDYIYGNTARVIQPARGERNHKQKTVRRKVVSYNVWRNQEKALHMNFPYVLMLTLAAFCEIGRAHV